MLKKIINNLLIISLAISIFGCNGLPYNEEDILYDYGERNCLYYTKNDYKKYRYRDYIKDDVINGEYKTGTPSVAEYRIGNGLLDYDIPAYVKARLDYLMKVELIKKNEYRVDEICGQIRDDSFNYKLSKIYFYDKDTKKSTLLYDGFATNIAYDTDYPMITFDVDDPIATKSFASYEGKKMLLSDILVSNSTPEGFMKVLLATGKKKLKFLKDEETFVDEAE